MHATPPPANSQPKPRDLYRLAQQLAEAGDTHRAREVFQQADRLAEQAGKDKPKPAPAKNKGGRPPLPPSQRTESRSIRLNDARWHKLRALGMDWLARQIDRAPDPQPGAD